MEIDLIALRDENAALKSQVGALTQIVGLTLSLIRKWTAVNEVDLDTLCDIAAQDHPNPHAAEAVALVRVLAIGLHGAAPHVIVPHDEVKETPRAQLTTRSAIRKLS